MKRTALAFTLLVMLTTAVDAAAQARSERRDPLREASGSIEALVNRVSGSVVQIVVTGYRPVARGPERTDVALGRSRGIGSGFVIDPQGYIMTNAHVVAGAERIDVMLPTAHASEARLASAAAKVVQARLVGLTEELDLALLKVEALDLRPLPLAAYESVRQGELVFAFGSPDGLRNSVSMGMVSAVARQTEPDSPIVYVQTDAAINPGNSGGPLVNADGEVVGVNTFIRSASGGSEGLGFALPSALVALAYPQLRDFGHMHRATIGLAVQTVTPIVAAGLSLPPEAGLIVSDVVPGSPAAAAGLQTGDVLVAIDRTPLQTWTLARFYLQLFSLKAGQSLSFDGLRGAERGAFAATVIAADSPHICERATLLDTGAALVSPLGILGVSIDESLADRLPALRVPSGVVVAARVDSERGPGDLLEKGDVIHAVNGVAVSSVDALRTAVDRIEPRGAVVLQIERDGQLTYVAFERD
jgi:serine protease Do